MKSKINIFYNLLWVEYKTGWVEVNNVDNDFVEVSEVIV